MNGWQLCGVIVTAVTTLLYVVQQVVKPTPAKPADRLAAAIALLLVLAINGLVVVCLVLA